MHRRSTSKSDDLASFVGSEPQHLDPFIAEIEEDVTYFSGTPIRAVATKWRQLPSGLIIPSATGSVAPIDQLLVYLTSEEVFGIKPPPSLVYSHIRRIPFDEIITCSSHIMATIRNPGRTRREVDDQFARIWFNEPIRTRVLNRLRDGTRGLVVPQAVFSVIQKAAFLSGDALVFGREKGNYVLSLISLGDYLGYNDNDNESRVITKKPGKIGREVIANQVFNARVDEASVLSRFWRIWFQLPKELRDDPEMVDLESVYLDAVGVPLWDVCAAAILLWASAIKGTTNIDEFLDERGWGADRFQDAISVFSIRLPEFREAVARELEQAETDWSFDAFRRYPVVQLWDDKLSVIDPDLLLMRVFGWVPVHEVKSYIDPKDEQKKARFNSGIRRAVEEYSLEVLESIVPTSSGSKRMYRDSDISRAYGGHKVRLPDAAIDYGTSWVPVEITTSQLRRESIAGLSDDYIVQDLEKFVKKVEQLDSLIRKLQDNETLLTGSSCVNSRLFYPVLVLPEGFPVNPITMTLVHEKIGESNLLNDKSVMPLEIVDIEDLEMIEALQEQSGPSFLQLLDGKKNAGLRDLPMRDYILSELRLSPRRSSRVDKLWQEIFKELFRL
ncbi:hypothetical protein SAMN06265360_12019 [Haloechinothrix alba]|uniref:Uncharacterized protein n=1 Tax=Haloechinothrix alba TaxID=664784 RepID=A0A238Z944_9PSEU|nr:hypothetical protein [Haloechinothrix alba]SNR80006.1 hypothetical protein SAMN06265360_12019 [Haloechinothrix alba]